MRRVLVGGVAAAVLLLVVPAVQAGGAPSISWSPTTSTGAYDFGSGLRDPKAVVFTLANSGGSATSQLAISLTGSSAFAVTADKCSTKSVSTKKTCAVTVQYTPAVGASDTATLTATGVKPDVTASITLTGAGLPPYTGTFSEISPFAHTFTVGVDWNPGPSSHTADGNLQPAGGIIVPATPTPSSASGCSAADFAGFIPGNVVLIQRGTCNFGVKVLNATAAGATGVIIFNEGNPGRTDAFNGTMVDAAGNPFVAVIPVAFTSYAVGTGLLGQYVPGTAPTVHLSVSPTSP